MKFKFTSFSISSESCRFCLGTGTIVVELGGGEKEVSQCINCEGKGNIVCTTCQGSGVQPRYLDRRSTIFFCLLDMIFRFSLIIE